ncbi:YcaO-like family protein [Streptomyces montanisoli]|uniref:YcaO-like family protein n=1 Tax=Streptomyces montanisoli TaxID=2798581 RepID=A0A940RTY5_9ACTN|nr:YcaO-like family protein [Streptomyces montanisoli]MBP0456595.1 YcaO-like family protein [Streptomyces montanisoli]
MSERLRCSVRQDELQRAEALRRRMHGRLCGVVPLLDHLTRSRSDPRMLILSADLTGVHHLHGLPAPEAGSFHLGGFGTQPFEARIRVLAESLERYACHMASREGRFPVRVASHRELAAAGERVPNAAAMTLFGEDQHAGGDFWFDRFDPDAPLGWIELPSLLDRGSGWVPAQWYFLDYVPRDDEPWLAPAVTTGAAAHTDPEAALAAALSEAVQIDSAIGHWHGTRRSVRIVPDRRTAVVAALVSEIFPRDELAPEFHLLTNPDLPGFTVACLLRRPPGLVPQIAVGLGSGTALVPTMYRALLEAAGVRWLAGWLAVENRIDHGPGGRRPTAEDLYGLEANVGAYAAAEGAKVVEDRFAQCDEAFAGDLPPDDERPRREQIASLAAAYRESGKDLFFADLTTTDVRALGFTAVRVFSPDTLVLPLPAAPQAAHPRFHAFGGFSHDAPHPYP